MVDMIDARGLSCPEPVIKTKTALEKNPAGISIMLDSAVSKENVQRFAENIGYTVSISKKDDSYTLKISK